MNDPSLVETFGPVGSCSEHGRYPCRDCGIKHYPGCGCYFCADVESDPTGRTAHDPGAKLDHGKNRLGLVLHGFPHALQAVGDVGTYGANKYSDNGWMSVPDGINRYTDAMYRHLLAAAAGEECDRDTGLLHAAHAAWNALARLELEIRQQQ